MVGVAVKVTLVPEQVGLAPVVIAMLTEGVSGLVIVNAIALLVAVGEVTQERLLVITQVILPPAVPASVYVALLVPTFAPSFFH